MQVIPPRSREWREIFRFIVQTMDADDPNMDFVISLWGFSVNNDGILTDAQARRIRPYCRSYLLSRGIDLDAINCEASHESA